VEKSGSKDSQKTSLPNPVCHLHSPSPLCNQLLISSLSLFAVPATTVITVSFLATITTTGSQHSHRPALTTVDPLPLQIFLLFLSSCRSHRQPPPLAPRCPPPPSKPPQVSLPPPSSSSSSSSSVVSTVHVVCEQWRVIHCSFLKKNSKFFF